MNLLPFLRITLECIQRPERTHTRPPVLSLEPSGIVAFFFISNRVGQACVIDALQTMLVRGTGAWGHKDSFQMKDVCFYHLLLSANLPYL